MKKTKFKIDSLNLINKRFNNLKINRDYFSNPKSHFPVFLFTPDMENVSEHFHISLSRKTANKLRKWLDKYEKDRKKKI